MIKVIVMAIVVMLLMDIHGICTVVTTVIMG